MQYLIGTNSRMPLLHMSKSYIWLEKTNQCINKFYIGYTMNSKLHKNKGFKDQVEGCLKHTFGTSTNIHIIKILLKKIQEC